MDSNREICKGHKINYFDMIDFFIKSRSILIKEKIWNLFKNKNDMDSEEFMQISEIKIFLKNNLTSVNNFF